MSEKATGIAYATSGGTVVLGGFSANEIGIAIGAAVAIATFCVNFWFKHQHLKLAKIAMERRLAMYEQGSDD